MFFGQIFAGTGCGDVRKEIVKFAETYGSDMIVIPTHGLTGIEHQLPGITTEKIIRLAPCPVFTVKAFAHSLIST